MSDLRYPVGPFAPPARITPDDRARLIEEIALLPPSLRAAVVGLDRDQLDTPYRPGGWTVRQVVHHVPDSHVNAYVRFKLALTEDNPVIRTYEEAAWATLPDTRSVPVEVSLRLLEALHERWVTLLRSVPDGDWLRRYTHPDSGEHGMDYLLAMYAWHGRHHVAHITALRSRKGW